MIDRLIMEYPRKPTNKLIISYIKEALLQLRYFHPLLSYIQSSSPPPPFFK